MKDQILKLAGVKTDKQFYAKYPSEAEFMKEHGKAFKKAQLGASMNPKPLSFSDSLADTTAAITGVSRQEQARRDALASQQAIANASGKKEGGGFMSQINPQMISQAMSMFGGEGGGDAAGAMELKNGGYVKAVDGWGPQDVPEDAFDPQMPDDYQAGNLDNVSQNAFGGVGSFDFAKQDPRTNPDAALSGTSKFSRVAGQVSDSIGGMGGVGKMIGQVQQIQEAYREQDRQEQGAQVSGVVAQAAGIRPEQAVRRYNRPEQQLFQPNQLSNSFGSGGGSFAENGAEIQNTYAPYNDLYSDLGYEPLDESNVKQYDQGGRVPRFDWGGLANMAGSYVGGGGGEITPEGQIGGTIGEAAGSFIPVVGRPLGKAIGSFTGGIFGGARAKKTEGFRQESMDNTLSAAASNFGQGLQQQHSNVMEDGGYVSHDWNPQVIAKFGDMDVSKMHTFFNKGMDNLRSGGSITQNYMDPQEESMMEMGGELETHWGGDTTIASTNPYLPGKETVMWGAGTQTHDESDGQGNTGVGISVNGKAVEVQKGEYGMKDSKGNFHIAGGMMINKDLAAQIGDPKAAGKKFQNYFKDKTKEELKWTTQIEKSTKFINAYKGTDPISKLEFNAHERNIDAANGRLKEIADNKLNAISVQDAILTTAEERKMDPNKLLKNLSTKLNKQELKAAFGGKLSVARNGIKIAADGARVGDVASTLQGLVALLNKKGYASSVTSGVRSGKTKSGNESRHNAGEAIDVVFPKLGKAAHKALMNDPEITKYLYDNDLTAIDEYDPKVAKQTGATGGHIHFGHDKGTSLANRYRGMIADSVVGFLNLTDNLNDAIPDNVKDFVGKFTKTPASNRKSNAPAILPTYNDDPNIASNVVNNIVAQEVQKAKVAQAPVAVAPTVKASVAQAIGKATTKAAVVPKPLAKTVVNPQPAKSAVQPIVAQPSVVASQAPVDMSGAGVVAPGSFDMFAGMRPPAIKEYPLFSSFAKPATAATATTGETTTVSPQTTHDWWKDGKDFTNNLLPYLRPTNQQRLDPAQLYGEMLALGTNQLEPVQAQSYQPLLNQPYSISLQDQLNANQSDFNALQRQTGYNPSAQSALAAQKYAANSKVLGEEFRLNQGEKARVYSENRNILNDAQLKNIGMYDQQFQRQSQAKSNTKQQAITALNSISSKIAQNKLENRTLGVYENAYNYRYLPNGQAVNMNQLQNFNMPNFGPGASSAEQVGKDPVALQEARIETAKAKLAEAKAEEAANKTTKANGGIVKAMHDL